MRLVTSTSFRLEQMYQLQSFCRAVTYVSTAMAASRTASMAARQLLRASKRAPRAPFQAIRPLSCSSPARSESLSVVRRKPALSPRPLTSLTPRRSTATPNTTTPVSRSNSPTKITASSTRSSNATHPNTKKPPSCRCSTSANDSTAGRQSPS